MAYTTVQNIPVPTALVYVGGYKLKFQENFYAMDVDFKPYSPEFHTWVNGIWFDDPNPSADIKAADGVGTLTWHKEQLPSYNTTIRSLQDFRYGYFEANFRFDAVEGSWPAFWLLSSETMNDRTLNGGEFDIMEWMSSSPSQCFFNFHKWTPGGKELGAPTTVTFNAHDGFSFSDYHTYAILWTPGNVDWYIDNVYYGSCPIDREIESHHYYLMLGAQAGLDWKDDPETLARIPASQIQVQAKWIRVWQQSQ